MIIDVPISVKVKVHKCPHCGWEYWRSSESQHLFCDTPYRKCSMCCKEFTDKDLYVEWVDMTDKQKRKFIHWNGESHRIVLACFGWFCAFFVPLFTIAFIFALIEGNEMAVGFGILSTMAIAFSLLFLFSAYKKYHLMKNYFKVDEIVYSLKRTGDYDSILDKLNKNNQIDKNIFEAQPFNDNSEEIFLLIKSRHKSIQKLLLSLKKKKRITSDQFPFIQEIILKYDSHFLLEVETKYNSISDICEKNNFLRNTLYDLECDLKKLKDCILKNRKH